MLDNENLPKMLQNIGFSEKEAIVYACLVSLGGAFPSQISEHTKLNRTTIYAVLVSLTVKGLVNEIKKRNKLFYQTESPGHLLRYVKSQVALAEDRVERTQKLIPDLEGLYQLFTNKPKVRYFEGGEGLLRIYEDMVSETKKYEMLAWSNTKELENVLPKTFFDDFRRAKERKGITTRGIVPDTQEDRGFTDKFFSGYKKEIVPRLRYVPAGKFPYEGEVTIYGTNKVAIVNLKKEYLTGLIIEDETIHNMMRMIFELSWGESEK